MKIIFIFLVFIILVGCEPEKDAPLDPKTTKCIENRMNEELASTSMEIVSRITNGKGWIDITLEDRRLNESICLEYVKCLSENESEQSLMFDKCLKENEDKDN